jgi:hypothetical protein
MQEKIWIVIGAPHKLFNSSIVNTQSNAHRNKYVKIELLVGGQGRAADGCDCHGSEHGVHLPVGYWEREQKQALCR